MTTPRTRARLTLAAIVIAVAALIGGITFAATRQPNTPQDSSPTASSDAGGEEEPTTTQEYAGEPSSDNATDDEETPATVVTAQKFLPAYTATDRNEKAWLKNLAPLTTPEMLVSLRTSDRGTAKTLQGASLAATSDGNLLITKDDQTLASLELVQMPTDSDQGGDASDAPWVISGIDFASPPKNTALPLPRNADIALTDTAQPAMTALLAQPAGMSDKDRTAQIKAAFTAPKHAVKTKRAADWKKRVVVGNVQDTQLTAEDDTTIALTSTMPWKVDGTSDVQWATHTILLQRDKNGTWTPTDAQ